MPTKTEAIKNFLNASTHSDLSILYNYGMEVQCNVAKDNGERISTEGYRGRTWHSYSDGIQKWYGFRIPRKASSDPEYSDTEIKFDLAEHAEGIGLTGWCWTDKMSKWVGFDFDSILDHSNNALTNLEIEAAKKAACEIPWVTVRKSTSGNGLHLYVFLNNVPTENHTEHAALARAILGKMVASTGFDFNSKVDGCGGVLWVWHRKITKQNQGLELIKQGSILKDIPSNWKDHILVIKGKRKKNLPKYIEDENISDFEKMTEQRSIIKLDDKHKKLLEYLEKNNCQAWWDSDHHILICHTFDLKNAHKELRLRGIFDTIATGREQGSDHNCLSGDTEIITREGPRLIKDVAKEGGAYLYVATLEGMKWIWCKVKSFGIQETVPIQFGNYSEIRATLNHEWLYHSNSNYEINLMRKKKTYELRQNEGKNHGDYLPLAPFKLPKINWKGYSHGFVYGDGWSRNCRGKTSCEVSLFKRDIDLLKLLSQYGNLGFEKYPGHGYITTIRQLPDNWKHLPENPTKEYALSFILGLISADGFVHKSGIVNIYQSNYGALKEIRKLSIYAGLRTRNIRLYVENPGYKESQPGWALSIETYNLTKEYFIRQDHKKNFKAKKKCRNTTVLNIDFNDKIKEEVFCAIVPSYHNFTLANGIITGNCFCYPLPQPPGAWVIRRYSQGVQESPSWDQDASGWTRCFYNREPTLDTAARTGGGMEDEKNNFEFKEVPIETIKSLGIKLTLPKWALTRRAQLKQHKDGRLLVYIERTPNDDPSDMLGWRPDKSWWKRIFNAQLQQPGEPITLSFDNIVRHLVTPQGADFGWVVKTANKWNTEPYINIRNVLKAHGMSESETIQVLGGCVLEPWTLINEPFQNQFPGGRKWNQNAAQFAFIPKNEEPFNFPTWQLVLSHSGKGLDLAISENGWCQTNDIKNGADYLKIWIASLFQCPKKRLPYLFLYSKEERTGKTTFHNAVGLLMTSGYKRADLALISGSGFNGELEHAILCAIEEVNLQKNPSARNRMKDWVTGTSITIHHKNKTPYEVENTAHFIQTGNDTNECPIYPGDSRITMIHVPPFELSEMLTPDNLFTKLKNEASNFMGSLLKTEIPPSNDRLNIPVIDTDIKFQTSQINRTPLEIFLEEMTYDAPGEMILYSDLFNKFLEWLDPGEIYNWSKIKFGRELPIQYPKGRVMSQGAQFYVGNISFTEQKNNSKQRLVLHRDKLC